MTHLHPFQQPQNINDFDRDHQKHHSVFVWLLNKMVVFNLFREDFFGFSLRKACLIFGFFDLNICIFFFMQFLFEEKSLYLLSVVAVGGVWLIPLFYALYREDHRILWMFIISSVILTAHIVPLLGWNLYVLIDSLSDWNSKHYANLYIVVFAAFSIAVGIFLLMLLIQILVVRNYQVQLMEIKAKERMEIPLEEKSFV